MALAVADADDQDYDQLGTEAIICWYQWDPELKTFRRGCEDPS